MSLFESSCKFYGIFSFHLVPIKQMIHLQTLNICFRLKRRNPSDLRLLVIHTYYEGYFWSFKSVVLAKDRKFTLFNLTLTYWSLRNSSLSTYDNGPLLSNRKRPIFTIQVVTSKKATWLWYFSLLIPVTEVVKKHFDCYQLPLHHATSKIRLRARYMSYYWKASIIDDSFSSYRLSWKV